MAPDRTSVDCSAEQIAVGSEEGDFTLSVPEDNEGRASLVHHGDGASVTVPSVLVVTVNPYSPEVGWPSLETIFHSTR